MSTDYPPERIAMMAEEFLNAARALGITLPLHGGSAADSNRDAFEEPDASELIMTLLDSSSDWAATSGSRAAGPYGAFLAGAQPNAPTETAGSVCARIELIISGLSHVDE